MQFRTLTAREIDCRVAQIKKNGLTLLLYKDARCDMAILDETVGSMNWQRRHTRDNANCIVSIWDEDKKCWIEKEDTGTESYTEAEKGLASDSFKRACVNVGIGRELYTAPFIWIPSTLCEIKESPNGKLVCNDRFDVSEIGYNEHREINKLVIVNAKSRSVVFSYDGVKVSDVKSAKELGKEKLSQVEKQIEEAKAEKKPRGKAVLATDEQKDYIKKNADDETYVKAMQAFGVELENMTLGQATKLIERIDNGGH